MLGLILVILGILLMLARGFGFAVSTRPNVDFGWIGAALAVIGFIVGIGH